MINKERLNKIIQEEVQKLLNEQPHVKAMLVYEHIEETLGADAVTELEEMSLESIEEIDEVAPPGKEKMVKKLKKTLPKKNGYTNGSFIIYYEELNQTQSQ